ncbi:MAG: Lrp/AsnC ligand binding domain-containing protein [Chloroflexi bacterium]|nr:Lrp/AsnC ligand binding domain-containing protein [Chloroflexota bacterium]
MELKEVLEQVPGVSRRFVYYLEARGYIRPAKVPKQRIARREYGQEDLGTIREMWRYYERGYALQTAYDLATARERVIAYLGVQVSWEGLPPLVERLKDVPQVVEINAVHGAEAELLVKTATPEPSEIYHTLVPLLAEAGVSSLPSVLLTREGFHREGPGASEQGDAWMMAYVLMKVPGKDVDGVMEQLKGLAAVREASTIYGETDIIAKVEVADQEELDTLVMDQIHGIPAVQSTRTFLVVRRFHWTR